MNSKLDLIRQILRYRLNRPTLPINVTLAATSRCNSRCLTCRIWQHPIQNELDFSEWVRIFQSLGKNVYWATITGGEPFLRADLAEYIHSLHKYCQPAQANIPTNTLLPDIIAERTKQILQTCLNLKLTVNLSMDGVGVVHDEIRGVPGNFNRFLEAYRRLRLLKTAYPNLTLGIHTVISRFNLHHMKETIAYAANLQPDYYIMEPAEIRREMHNDADITVSADDLIDPISTYFQTYGTHGTHGTVPAFRRLYYEYILGYQPPPPCYAGRASCQITADGEVWACCINGESMGNLRETGYNFDKVWFSEKAAKIRDKIRLTKCSCQLANQFYTATICHIPSLLKLRFT